jgi:hypothetical protein
MTKDVYRSANGKQIDMGALRLKNEHVRAVGNMQVNARGDLVDENNQVITPKNQQATQNYNKQVTNPKGTK